MFILDLRVRQELAVSHTLTHSADESFANIPSPLRVMAILMWPLVCVRVYECVDALVCIMRERVCMHARISPPKHTQKSGRGSK